MGLDAVTVTTVELAERGLHQVRGAVKRLAANDVLMAGLGLSVLIVIFFYDVVFLDRTLITSPFAFERIGVTGTSPPFGYPDSEPPQYNVYLMDPLPSAWGMETAVKKVNSSIGDLEVPLWESNVALGRPFLGSMSAGVTSPLLLPVMLWPSAEMWDALFLVRFLIAGLFTYILAKRLGMAKPAAFGAAVAYAFSGYFMLFLNMPNADFAMMVPVLLVSFDLLAERATAGRTVLAALAVGVGTLANNPEAALILVLYGGGYFLVRVWGLRRSLGEGYRTGPRVAALCLAGTAGAGLTAFTLIPFIELAGALGAGGHSIHLHGAGSGRGLEFAPLERMVSLFMPYFRGPTRASFIGGDWTGIRTYFGAAVPLLGLIGLWNRPLMLRAGWFFLTAAILFTAKWFGFPGINSIGDLPVLNAVTFGQYSPPAIGFSVAMLAGIGLDKVSREGLRPWHPPLAAIGVAVLLAWTVWLNRHNLDDIPTAVAWLHPIFAGAVVLTAVVLLLISYRRLLKPAVGTALLVGLIAAELFAFTLPTKGEAASVDSLRIVQRPERYNSLAEPPFVHFLKQDGSPYRVYGLERVLHPNVARAYGIDDIRGYTAVSVDRYVQYIRNFVNPRTGFRFTGSGWPALDRRGGASQLGDNSMLDLLNVKYVISPDLMPLAYDYHLAEKFLPVKPEQGARGRLDVFTITGEDELVLFQHPVSTLTYTFIPDEESRFFLFRLGMDPEVWRPDRGDGVLFRIDAESGGDRETLFSRFVDPKNEPADRRWIDGEVDLSGYLGREMTLVLSTGPGESGVWDWAGWGAPRLAPSPKAPQQESAPDKFRLVYDGDVKVYENVRAFPRAFVVHDVRTAATRQGAVALMREPGFDPARAAVLEGNPPDEQVAALPALPSTSNSTAEIVGYDDNRVKLRVNAESPGFLVLSDTFYPGWKAYLDGERARVYPADLALRSVFVPAGEHDVEFVYSPRSFKLGSAITLASLVTLGVVLVAGPVRRSAVRWRERRPHS